MDDRTMWEDLGIKPPKYDEHKKDIECVKVKCPPMNMYNYNRFNNKPTINGKVLQGDLTSADLGITTGNDLNYVHKQNEASDEWIILHNLGKYPTVSVLDSAGDEVIGDIHYDSLNQITIKFKGAFKGSATLN